MPSIFDNISKDDIVIAFFPCTRFENQIILHFTGMCKQMQGKSDIKKLELDLKLHNELHEYYTLITQMVIIALKKGFRMIIENPYSTQHYLTRYWAVKPKFIDNDRTLRGDYMTKPTQYWFINCEPKNNWINEPLVYQEEYRIHNKNPKGAVRSIISSDYANRFIKEFIL